MIYAQKITVNRPKIPWIPMWIIQCGLARIPQDQHSQCDAVTFTQHSQNYDANDDDHHQSTQLQMPNIL